MYEFGRESHDHILENRPNLLWLFSVKLINSASIISITERRKDSTNIILVRIRRKLRNRLNEFNDLIVILLICELG